MKYVVLFSLITVSCIAMQPKQSGLRQRRVKQQAGEWQNQSEQASNRAGDLPKTGKPNPAVVAACQQKNGGTTWQEMYAQSHKKPNPKVLEACQKLKTRADKGDKSEDLNYEGDTEAEDLSYLGW
jgi:hypothetical protein